MPGLAIKQTPIPGLLVISLDIRGDNRAGSSRTGNGKMVDLACLTSRRCRTTCRSTTESARRAASIPSLGTSSCHWQQGESLAPGLTSVEEKASAAASRRRWVRRPQSLCHAGSGTPSRPCWNRLPIPTSSMITGIRQRRSLTPSSALPMKCWRSNGRSHSRRVGTIRGRQDASTTRQRDASGTAADLDHRGWWPARARADQGYPRRGSDHSRHAGPGDARSPWRDSTSGHTAS
jgi:hypothetical protein